MDKFYKVHKVKLGVPAQLVHTETKKVLRNYMPYTTFDLATYDKERNEGVTLYAYNTYPHKIVFGRIGAQFAGYIT